MTTDLAISGQGFFVVSSDQTAGSIAYTRDGSFEVDSNGYLVSDGYYLQGWATSSDGKVIGSTSSASLTSINTTNITSSVAATENIELSAIYLLMQRLVIHSPQRQKSSTRLASQQH